MLKASNISKSFGDRHVLDGVTFVVNDGERLGVVAPNGAGKTTLLDILAGEQSPDGGSVQTSAGARIAYVRQGLARVTSLPVVEMFPAVFAGLDASSRIESLAAMLALAEGNEAVEDAQRAFDAALAAAASDARVTTDWRELELRRISPSEPVGALSGGEQTKLALLEAMAQRAGRAAAGRAHEQSRPAGGSLAGRTARRIPRAGGDRLARPGAAGRACNVGPAARPTHDARRRLRGEL